jgi:hypothetical protein
MNGPVTGSTRSCRGGVCLLSNGPFRAHTVGVLRDLGNLDDGRGVNYRVANHFSEPVSPGTIGAPTGIDVSGDGRRSGGGLGVHPLQCCAG